MKLSAKIALSVVLIVSLTVSISGYAIVSSVFNAQLEHQIVAAADETQLLCSVLGTMAVERRSSTSATVTAQTLQETLSISPFRDYSLRLATPTAAQSSSGETVDYQIVRVKDGADTEYEVVVTCRFSVDREVYFLESRHNVTELYQLRSQYLGIYKLVYLIAVAVSLVAGFALGALLTAPIRNLSRSARQIAGGNYSVRANVYTNDEIGILASQFNHMAEELERHIASLELATQQQKDFTASFAHELKTPLTSIIGYADTLRSRKLPEEQQFEAASFIFSEGRRLETMSHSLLRLFSLENETPQMQRFSALALAQSVEESMAYPMKQRQLVLEVRVEDRMLVGEKSLLEILLYNLLDNARKASKPGSKITLLGVRTPEGYCFAVKDRGRGIPPEAIDRITEPFYMVDKSRSRAEGGAGLGLALSQRIAQLHGTRLHYESKVGRGTVVSFMLREVAK